jgi:hypothetical protein
MDEKKGICRFRWDTCSAIIQLLHQEIINILHKYGKEIIQICKHVNVSDWFDDAAKNFYWVAFSL